jgi:NAD+ synthase (glutamine-hydrolysing)
MKLYLAQMNTTVGDFAGNVRRIVSACDDAASKKCDLILLPEMATTGYPPQDLLFLSDFIEANDAALREIAATSGRWPDLSLILGTAERSGLGLHNSAALIRGGRLLGHVRKTLLPTYDVFDEARYFKPATGWLLPSWKDVKLGVAICEDLWDDGYSEKVVPKLVSMGAQVILSISSSPFHTGKLRERIALLKRHAMQSKVPLAYCNMCGAEAELIFDGGSFAIGRDGRVVAAAPSFEEHALILEYDEAKHDFTGSAAQPEMPPAEEMFRAMVLGVRDFHHKQGFSKCVLGLSGGIDSSLVAAVAAHALGPENVLGVAMPSRITASDSTEDAKVLAHNLGVAFKEVPIEDSVKVAEERYARAFGLYQLPETRENLQARERGKILMEISNDQKRLLLTTGNKTEYALGYSTLYGDMCGALAVIGDLNKSEVYAVSRWVNETFGSPIPERVLRKKPSAELSPGQVDPFNYETVSPLVDALVEEQVSPKELVRRGYDEVEVKRCVKLLFASEHKRWQAPPMLRVSKRAFGIGRRMPLVNRFVP